MRMFEGTLNLQSSIRWAWVTEHTKSVQLIILGSQNIFSECYKVQGPMTHFSRFVFVKNDAWSCLRNLISQNDGPWLLFSIFRKFWKKFSFRIQPSGFTKPVSSTFCCHTDVLSCLNWTEPLTLSISHRLTSSYISDFVMLKLKMPPQRALVYFLYFLFCPQLLKYLFLVIFFPPLLVPILMMAHWQDQTERPIIHCDKLIMDDELLNVFIFFLPK